MELVCYAKDKTCGKPFTTNIYSTCRTNPRTMTDVGLQVDCVKEKSTGRPEQQKCKVYEIEEIGAQTHHQGDIVRPRMTTTVLPKGLELPSILYGAKCSATIRTVSQENAKLYIPPVANDRPSDPHTLQHS